MIGPEAAVLVHPGHAHGRGQLRRVAGSRRQGLASYRWCHDCTRKHYPYGMEEKSSR